MTDNEFQVLTYEAKILPHPNADRIELCQIGDYQSIVQKRTLNDGDVVAYIPEASIVPDGLLEQLGLTGKLSGKGKNRVKAIKLRGVLSQGLIYPMPNKSVGEDVTEELGVVKYEPPVPQQLKGRTLGAMYGKTLTYPIKNIKLFPNEITEEDTVVITEKLHGTWCCLGYYEDVPVVTSKGLSGKGIVLDPEDDNVYSNAWNEHNKLIEAIKKDIDEEAFYVLGEIYGRGIQDLQYNTMNPSFRVFDIYVGKPGQGRYLELSEVFYMLQFAYSQGQTEQMHVPVLYHGPYHKEILLEYTNGQSTLGGNIREGVVVRTSPERLDSKNNRTIYKSISEDYLLRKGGSEFN